MQNSKTLTLTVTIPLSVPDMTDAELHQEVWDAVVQTAAVSHRMSIIDLLTDQSIDAARRSTACEYHEAWAERLINSTCSVERNA